MSTVPSALAPRRVGLIGGERHPHYAPQTSSYSSCSPLSASPTDCIRQCAAGHPPHTRKAHSCDTMPTLSVALAVRLSRCPLGRLAFPWVGLLPSMVQVSDEYVPWLIILQAWTMPLQGLANACVFSWWLRQNWRLSPTAVSGPSCIVCVAAAGQRRSSLSSNRPVPATSAGTEACSRRWPRVHMGGAPRQWNPPRAAGGAGVARCDACSHAALFVCARCAARARAQRGDRCVQ